MSESLALSTADICGLIIVGVAYFSCFAILIYNIVKKVSKNK